MKDQIWKIIKYMIIIIKWIDYNSENESEDSFSDLEPLGKRKLRKNKEKEL